MTQIATVSQRFRPSTRLFWFGRLGNFSDPSGKYLALSDFSQTFFLLFCNLSDCFMLLICLTDQIYLLCARNYGN